MNIVSFVWDYVSKKEKQKSTLEELGL
jgi:hypothetical protein